MHSIEQQEAYEERQGMSDDVDALRCTIQELNAEIKELKSEIEDLNLEMKEQHEWE